MDYNNTDIIIARATPIGKSALAIIRLSGVYLISVLTNFFPHKVLKPNFITLCPIKKMNSNLILDSCMVVYYKNPKSFTGEDMLEIFCHGNDVTVEEIINEFLIYGIRIAYPGEFSYRAFKNGKIDLLQAESIAAKINQNSNQYGVALQNLENGSTSKKLIFFRKKILDLQSVIEHELDFNEEEITHMSINQIKNNFKNIKEEINIILNWSLYLRVLDKGYKITILGLPNAGKSTLFNRISGIDRAIVTEIKGTTRDTLEASVQIKGIPFIFYDTAGYRNTKNKIETIGINKTIQIAKSSNVILMMDEKNPVQQFKTLSKKNEFLKKKSIIFIQSKCDKIKTKNIDNVIQLSCKNDLGINQLLTTLLTVVNKKIEKNTSSNIALCNARQINLFKKIKKILNNIIKDLNRGLEMDIIASQTKEIVDLIEEMLGKMTTNEILNNIFKGFCVGK